MTNNFFIKTNLKRADQNPSPAHVQALLGRYCQKWSWGLRTCEGAPR